MRLKRNLLYSVSVFCTMYVADLNAWTINNTFDNQAVGETCGYSAHRGGSAWWNAEKSFVTSANSYSGKHGCSLTINSGSKAGGWGGGTTFPKPLKKGDQIWVRLRTFMPKNFNYDATSAGNKLKFLRLRTNDASGKNTGYVDWYINPKGSTFPFQSIYEGGQAAVFGPGGCTSQTSCWHQFGAGKAIELGKWETYEYYVRFDTVPVSKGGTARVRTWKNGQLMADMTDKITLARPDGESPAFLLFNYWNGGSPQTQTMYVDDVVLTTDTPSAVDSTGFPYIGVGTVSATTASSITKPAAKPNPPVVISK